MSILHLKSDKSLKKKIILPTITVILIGFIILCLVTQSIFYYVLIKQINNSAIQMSYNYSNQLKSKLDSTISTSVTLASMIENRISNNRTNRPELESELISVARQQPDLLAVYAIFENNKYGNNDKDFINTNYGSETGRFSPYIVNSDSQSVPLYAVYGLIEQTVTEYHYTTAKSTQKQYISAPYIYEVDGKSYYAVSIVSPIMVNNEFCGIAAVNILVDELFEKFATATIFNTGYITITTDKDIVAYSPISEQISKPITDVFDNNIISGFNSLNTGTNIKTIQSKSIVNNKSIISYIAPIKFQGYEGNWKISVNIPVSEARVSIYVALIILIILTIVIITVSILILMRVINKITDSIQNITQSAEKIALGDVDLILNVESDDELGTLSKAFNLIVEHSKNQTEILKKIKDRDLTVELKKRSDVDIATESITQTIVDFKNVLTKVLESSTQLAYSSNNIAEISKNLAQGSCEQTDTINILLDTITDISQKINQSVVEIQNVNQVVKVLNNEFDTSKSKMNNMVLSINEINYLSQQINEIIKTIDSIASQTNMIALNASIEAARAGEAGKGFAIVADQVRILAASTGKAVKDTTDLIQKSISSVERGVNITNETAESLEKVIKNVDSITEIIERISLASNDNLDSVEKINSDVKVISDIATNNSAIAEEQNAASEELAAQSALLEDFVSEFKLNDTQRRK